MTEVMTLQQGRYNRERARQQGDKTYHNRRCKVCKSSERYTNSSACVQCTNKKALDRYYIQNSNQVTWRENRRRAKDQGVVSYHGKTCAHCNHSDRYTSNKACITCHKAVLKKSAQLKRRPSVSTIKDPTPDRLPMLLSRLKTRAMKKQLPFNLNLGDLVIPSHCPIFGLELSWEGTKDNSPSVDRLDNTRGYTRDNIRIISTRANLLKNSSTAAELRAIADWMDQELAA
jgi:hypothetical protein